MKKITKWKSFDFGPETSVNKKKSPVKKRKSLDDSSNSIKISTPPKSSTVLKKKLNFDFTKKIIPNSVADLVVHNKKIQEIEGWLTTVLDCPERKRTEFLLISGPTGSGKASTIHVLCKSMKVDVTEWTNPIDIDYDIFKGPGQVTKFLEFFSESKYCSLFSSNMKKVLLVKDFPNAVIRNPDEFFNVLEEVSYKATYPVIFICTDSNSNDINLQRYLFPEEILLKYSISHISFNSCAPTLLKKGLKRAIDILQSHPELFKSPSPSIIEAILASSMGDIRCAMNQLYLACMTGQPDIPLEKTKVEKMGTKRKRKDQPGTIKHMIRDERLGLFHGLGRVLNPKRTEEGSSWRINCDIQKLIDEFSIQPSKFTSFLCENYLKYFGDFEDAAKAADVLSLSTCLLENWENHDTLIMALWVAVLGLMIFNEHKAQKWNQIKAPRKFTKTSLDEMSTLHPTDRFYYNMITKTEKYHRFNCD